MKNMRFQKQHLNLIFYIKITLHPTGIFTKFISFLYYAKKPTLLAPTCKDFRIIHKHFYVLYDFFRCNKNWNRQSSLALKGKYIIVICMVFFVELFFFVINL
ncbi:hypothetical protein EDEG_03953 [Edhazardia aedis USNM 41457]|uniref:Uncharacterized protein n=1 Tax=Edhazardia aedis (strain USNM 41457) TaxID=1003232 RepID=J9D0Q6_EDHAE|nr:hypothetical protein EDEG_03953 [Edhazardia aedis USNM 41457]|eukprot:EJW01461.1 hypothetical protein EDEG_03953 [Edhazardia aedis USNM 41457]